jgi:hypothetical protein
MNTFTHRYLLANEKLIPFQEKIEEVLDGVEEEVLEKLEAVPVDVVIKHGPYLTIPELGIVGRYTREAKLIEIALDVDHEHLKENLEEELKRTLAHEYMHAVREEYVQWENGTLLDGIISEGLTQSFELEVNPELEPAIYATHLSEEELEASWQKIQPELNKKEYDYNAWFFGDEEKGIKRWTGYSLGYWLVQKKMEETGKRASELVKCGSKNFLI